MNTKVLTWYDDSYSQHGFKSQRNYPNEELCRFIGTYYPEGVQRNAIKILEVGCGYGANLWMLIKEGFDTYGIDCSESAITLCQDRIAHFGPAHISTGNMCHTNFPEDYFDAVLDVFSGNCFNHMQYIKFISEVSRILKTGGLFFFFTPCVTSKAFIDHSPASLLDQYTLNGIKRPDSPYYGNDYPFHFLDAAIVDSLMGNICLYREKLYRVTRTHHNLDEPFSHLVGIYKKLTATNQSR